MIGLVVIVVVALALFAAGAVLYTRHAGRVTHRRASTGLGLRAGETSPDALRAFAPRAPMFGGSEQHAGLLPPMVLELPGPLLSPADDRRADAGPPPGVDDRRRRDVGPAGRHRRDEAGPDAVTMTGFMQQLTAEAIARDAHMQAAVDAETGRIPRVQP